MTLNHPSEVATKNIRWEELEPESGVEDQNGPVAETTINNAKYCLTLTVANIKNGLVPHQVKLVTLYSIGDYD